MRRKRILADDCRLAKSIRCYMNSNTLLNVQSNRIVIGVNNVATSMTDEVVVFRTSSTRVHCRLARKLAERALNYFLKKTIIAFCRSAIPMLVLLPV
jgi:hypothetical protein